MDYVARVLHVLHLFHQVVPFADIKPENLLISKDNTLKLCDFGKWTGLWIQKSRVLHQHPDCEVKATGFVCNNSRILYFVGPKVQIPRIPHMLFLFLPWSCLQACKIFTRSKYQMKDQPCGNTKDYLLLLFTCWEEQRRLLLIQNTLRVFLPLGTINDADNDNGAIHLLIPLEC